MKRLITFVLLLVTLSTLPVNATESKTNDVDLALQPVTKNIATTSIDASLSISSSGKADVFALVIGDGNVDHATVKVQLQKQVSGKWSTIKSWFDYSSTDIALVESYYYVPSGYNYKLVIQSYVYGADGGLLEYLKNETKPYEY